jgi:hypothetical protein
MSAALLVVSQKETAGVGLFDGESEESWVRARYSVVVAKVDAVAPADTDSTGALKLTLLPQATLGGTFDCGAEPRIVADCWYATGGDSAVFPDNRTRAGTLVLVLICMYESEDFRRVPNENCPLLPNRQPLCVIKGMDDPVIRKTLERIQNARAVAKKKQAEARKKQ